MSWFREHRFEAHVTVFLLMMVSAAGMYLAARQGASIGMVGGLALFALGNLLAVVVK